MSDVLSAAQMREVERAAISGGAVTGLTLMERAGRGVVAAVFARWPALSPAASVGRGASPSRSPEFTSKDEGRRALVLCGLGNNGGDGFVVARLLRDAGWRVDVQAVGWDMLWGGSSGRAEVPPDARRNAERWKAIGGRSGPLEGWHGRAFGAARHVLVVDALLGIGQNRDPSALLRHWWDQRDLMRDRNLYEVSVDVPTGYDADHGTPLCDRPFKPGLTVTFHRAKPVHAIADCGEVVVCDIGL